MPCASHAFVYVAGALHMYMPETLCFPVDSRDTFPGPLAVSYIDHCNIPYPLVLSVELKSSWA